MKKILYEGLDFQPDITFKRIMAEFQDFTIPSFSCIDEIRKNYHIGNSILMIDLRDAIEVLYDLEEGLRGRVFIWHFDNRSFTHKTLDEKKEFHVNILSFEFKSDALAFKLALSNTK